MQNSSTKTTAKSPSDSANAKNRRMSPSSGTKFQTDLKSGEKGERHVANALKKAFEAAKVSKAGSGKGFDFRLIYDNGKDELVEVKTDFMSSKTGNLFFEYSCNGKDSGLKSTEAQKWAILIPHLQEILVTCPKKLFGYLLSSTHRELKGGDRKAVKGYIVSIETIKKLSFVKAIPTNTRIEKNEYYLT